tara:strand:+ start:2796 stop:3029 length:234 start_codon:yes stop_codon:yes gene_type:complete
MDLLIFFNLKPTQMKEFLISKLLTSKKVWIGIASIIIPLVAKALDVDEESVSQIWWSLIAILGGQSLADLGKEAKKK